SRSSSACVCLPLWSSPSNATSRPESGFKGEDIVEGLAPANYRPVAPVHEPFRRQQVGVVIGAHHGAIGTRVENGDEIVDLEGWQLAIPGKDITAFADWTHHIPRRLIAGAWDEGHDLVNG